MEIDGSHGEAGGQLLRTSLSLSVLLQKPFHITKIRASRPHGGLQHQHLACVQALAELSGAGVEGAELHSQELWFKPKPVEKSVFRFDVTGLEKVFFDVHTAGSTLLLLQALLPPLAFASRPTKIELRGGTCAHFAPPQLYVQRVFVPSVAKMGLKLEMDVEKWGWFPKGGGVLHATVHPVERLSAFNGTERGALKELDCIAALSNLPEHIAQRMKATALKHFVEKPAGVAPKVELVRAPAMGEGAMFFVGARYGRSLAGFTSIGERGKPAEKVAEEACAAFSAFHSSKAAVDDRLADQIALYCALAQGRSEFTCPRVSKHLESNIWVIERFLPAKFEVEHSPGLARVAVEGIGFRARAGK
ncbi:MAG: RNA 3'-terminal phosphate cyclase [Candidatus Micrarchaeota archaeon]